MRIENDQSGLKRHDTGCNDRSPYRISRHRLMLSLVFGRTRIGNFLLHFHKLRAFVFIARKNVQSHGFAQFELVGTPRLTGTKQPLPIGCTGNILDVRSITVGERPLLYEVVSVAVWTFDVEAGCGHSQEAVADILPAVPSKVFTPVSWLPMSTSFVPAFGIIGPLIWWHRHLKLGN